VNTVVEDSAKVTDPHVLAAEIAEDLRSALEQIESVLGTFGNVRPPLSSGAPRNDDYPLQALVRCQQGS